MGTNPEGKLSELAENRDGDAGDAERAPSEACFQALELGAKHVAGDVIAMPGCLFHGIRDGVGQESAP